MRALVVAYAFPPVGGAGVQRVQKLVKYLPRYGVTPSVLTVANPSVPVRDASLELDVPEAIEIVRAPTLGPGYAAKKRALHAAGRKGGDIAPQIQARPVKLRRNLLLPH